MEEPEFIPPREFARKQRNDMTPAEEALWHEIQTSKLGYKFSRQIKVGRYFADFVCRQYRLVIELDGESHERRIEEDEARDNFMREQGYEVLRFNNQEVFDNMKGVLAKIISTLEGRPRWRY
jgi:very-short-patch-repair endonuclease